jgi:hypothetical protein
MKRIFLGILAVCMTLSVTPVAFAAVDIVEHPNVFVSHPTTGDETKLPGFIGKITAGDWSTSLKGVSASFADEGTDKEDTSAAVIAFGQTYRYENMPIDRVVVKGDTYWKTYYYTGTMVTGEWLQVDISDLPDETTVRSVSIYTNDPQAQKDYGSITINYYMQDESGNDIDVNTFVQKLKGGVTPRTMFQAAYTVNGAPITVIIPYLYDHSDTVMRFEHLDIDTEYTVSQLLEGDATVLTEPQKVRLTADSSFADFDFINKVGKTVFTSNNLDAGSLTIQTVITDANSSPVTPSGGEELSFTLTYSDSSGAPVSITDSCKPGNSVVFTNLPLNVEIIAAPSDLPSQYQSKTTPFIQMLTAQQPNATYTYNFVYNESGAQTVGEPILGMQSLLDSLQSNLESNSIAPENFNGSPEPELVEPPVTTPTLDSAAKEPSSSSLSLGDLIKSNPITGYKPFRDALIGLAAIAYALIIGIVIQRRIKMKSKKKNNTV